VLFLLKYQNTIYIVSVLLLDIIPEIIIYFTHF